MTHPVSRRHRRAPQRGQGLVEYALLPTLVVILVNAILTVLGPQLGGIFRTISSGLQTPVPTVDPHH